MPQIIHFILHGGCKLYILKVGVRRGMRQVLQILWDLILPLTYDMLYIQCMLHIMCYILRIACDPFVLMYHIICVSDCMLFATYAIYVYRLYALCYICCSLSRYSTLSQTCLPRTTYFAIGGLYPNAGGAVSRQRMSNRAAPQFLLNMYIYIYIHIYIRKTYRNLYGTYPLKVKHAVCTTCKYVCALAKSSELCTRRRQFAYMSLLKLIRIACCSTPYHTIHSALAMASVFDCQYKMIHDVGGQ